jgi:uroporphyrinogen-III synthase
VTARSPLVWVVATDESAARWSRGLEAAGFAATALPWSEVVAPDDPASLGAAFAEPADVVLLTSANALRFLPTGAGAGRRAACVGASTAEAAARAGFEVRLVGEAGGEELAERVVREMPAAAHVLFVHGSDAREEPVEVLRRAGRRVTGVVGYAKRPRAAFVAEVRAAPPPAALLVGSPRGAESLADALDAADRPDVRSEVPAIALGETTAARLRALGFACVRAATRPEPSAMAEAVRGALSGGGRAGRRRPLQ